MTPIQARTSMIPAAAIGEATRYALTKAFGAEMVPLNEAVGGDDVEIRLRPENVERHRFGYLSTTLIAGVRGNAKRDYGLYADYPRWVIAMEEEARRQGGYAIDIGTTIGIAAILQGVLTDPVERSASASLSTIEIFGPTDTCGLSPESAFYTRITREGIYRVDAQGVASLLSTAERVCENWPTKRLAASVQDLSTELPVAA